MSKGLMSVVGAVAEKFGYEFVTRVVTNGDTRMMFKGLVGPDGCQVGWLTKMPSYKHKFEYRIILDFLVNTCGFSIKDAAEACGISYSWATAQLRLK